MYHHEDDDLHTSSSSSEKEEDDRDIELGEKSKDDVLEKQRDEEGVPVEPVEESPAHDPETSTSSSDDESDSSVEVGSTVMENRYGIPDERDVEAVMSPKLEKRRSSRASVKDPNLVCMLIQIHGNLLKPFYRNWIFLTFSG